MLDLKRPAANMDNVALLLNKTGLNSTGKIVEIWIKYAKIDIAGKTDREITKLILKYFSGKF